MLHDIVESLLKEKWFAIPLYVAAWACIGIFVAALFNAWPIVFSLVGVCFLCGLAMLWPMVKG